MKGKRTTFTDHDAIPEQQFLNRLPADDVAVPKNPPAGERTVNRIDAWPGSAIVTTNDPPRAPASVSDATSGKINAGAAVPAQRRPGPPLHPNLHRAHPTIHSEPFPAPRSSIDRQRRQLRGFLRELRSARLLKMLPTAPADASPARTPRPTHVRRIPDGRLLAVRVHGTTAHDSTTDSLPRAAADWPDGSRLQRQSSAGSGLAPTGSAAGTCTQR